MFGRLGVFSAFLIYDISNLRQVYQNKTPLYIEEDLCFVVQPPPYSRLLSDDVRF